MDFCEAKSAQKLDAIGQIPWWICARLESVRLSDRAASTSFLGFPPFVRERGDERLRGPSLYHGPLVLHEVPVLPYRILDSSSCQQVDSRPQKLPSRGFRRHLAEVDLSLVALPDRNGTFPPVGLRLCCWSGVVAAVHPISRNLLSCQSGHPCTDLRAAPRRWVWHRRPGPDLIGSSLAPCGRLTLAPRRAPVVPSACDAVVEVERNAQ